VGQAARFWPRAARRSKGKLPLRTARPKGAAAPNQEISHMNALKNFVKDEQGLETVEYAIITGLIVAGVIATIAAIGAWVSLQFSNLKTELGA
jgi:Flp pilus assembly pilin Flp